MYAAAELAGFFAAHAIWNLSDGMGLTPMYAYVRDGDRTMERLISDDPARGVESGRRKLEENSVDAEDAVLVYDGRVDFGHGMTDAVVLEMRTYFSFWSLAAFAVPYASAETSRFRAGRAKIVRWEECDDFDLNLVAEAFERGVEGHEEGAAIWKREENP